MVAQSGSVYANTQIYTHVWPPPVHGASNRIHADRTCLNLGIVKRFQLGLLPL